MKKRIEKIKDLRHVLALLNISGNPALWIKEFLKNPDEKVLKEIEKKDLEISKEIKKNEYKVKRKSEYEKRGLTFDKFIEAFIEDDAQEIATFRNERRLVKEMFPKNEK